jgi:ribose transport system substrate-binding protein
MPGMDKNIKRRRKNMRNSGKALIVGVVLLLTVSMFAWSAGGTQAGGGGVKADKDIIIAVVPKALDNNIFLDAKTGAESKGKELGIRVEWVGPARSDAADQVNVIESLIQRKVDGILISCNNADALKDVIDRAVDAGIKVACFDSDSPASKRAFYIGTDNYAFGQQAADYMMDYLPSGGKVAILTGVLGAPNLEERIKGFRDRLTEKNSPIQVLPVQTGEDDVQRSVEVVTQFTTANPDLAGWFFDGGWPYFADPAALPEVRNFMRRGGRIVSIDTAYPMLQYLGEDMVDVLIGQNYIKMGQDGVEMLYKMAKGQGVDIPANKIIFTGSEIGTKENWQQLRAGKDPW